MWEKVSHDEVVGFLEMLEAEELSDLAGIDDNAQRKELLASFAKSRTSTQSRFSEKDLLPENALGDHTPREIASDDSDSDTASRTAASVASLVGGSQKKRRERPKALNVETALLRNMQAVVKASQASGKRQRNSIRMHLKNPPIVYAPVVTVLCTRLPIYRALKSTLLAIDLSFKRSKGLPLERILRNVLREVPIPPMGRLTVAYSVNDVNINIRRAPPNTLPELQSDFRILFNLLSVENIVRVFLALLVEDKVVIHAASYSVLAEVMDTFLQLLFPLQWHHIYIPVLPPSLHEFLEAPTPYFVGAHTATLMMEEDSIEDVVIVDLNSDEVFSAVPFPTPPHKSKKKLIAALKEIVTHASPEAEEIRLASSCIALPCVYNVPDQHPRSYSAVFSSRTQGFHVFRSNSLRNPPSVTNSPSTLDKPGQVVERDRTPSLVTVQSKGDSEVGVSEAAWGPISMAFLRFFTKLLNRYQEYLLPNPEPMAPLADVFDAAAFLKNDLGDERSGDFGKKFIESLAFAEFITRAAYPEPTFYDIRMFNESITAKRNRSRLSQSKATPFLSNTDWEHRHIYHCPLPDARGLEGYLPLKTSPSQVHVPEFNPALFGQRIWSRSFTTFDDVSTEFLGYPPIDSNLLKSNTWADIQQERERALTSRVQELGEQNAKVAMSAGVLSAIIKSRTQRKAYLKLQQAVKYLQRCARAAGARRRFLRTKSSVLMSQRYCRGWMARREALRRRTAMLRLNTFARRILRQGRLCALVELVVRAKVLALTVDTLLLWTSLQFTCLEKAKLEQAMSRVYGRNDPNLSIRSWEQAKTNAEVEFQAFRQLSKSQLQTRKKQAMEEKKTIYAKIKSEVKADEFEQWCTQFGINVKAKKRKQKLVDKLFVSTEPELAAPSAQLVLRVCKM